MTTASTMEKLYKRHVDMIYRICFVYLKNAADCEDAVSDTFIRLMENAPEFESEEHEKAWLIRVAINVCKNMLKRPFRLNTTLDEVQEICDKQQPDDGELMRQVLALPQRYKSVIYLYYFEGYSTPELAKMLGLRESSVRSQLLRGRQLLKTSLLAEEESERSRAL